MNCTGLRCTLHSLVIQASPIWAAPRIYDFFMRRENWITQKYNRGNPKLKGKISHFRFTVERCPGNNNRLLTESEGRTGGSAAQASSISKFILCHPACDSKMHFRWLALKGRPCGQFSPLPWNFEFDGLAPKEKYTGWTVSTETVRTAKSWPRKNQSEHRDLPKTGFAGKYKHNWK